VVAGLLAIGLIGAAVGLGVISGGVALVIILGLAAYAGISSYLARRDEIERTHYEVPIPQTMLASAGDIVGLSQLIEGITGERIDSGRRLDSLERSDQLDVGSGSIALILAGSRAYRGGQRLGTTTRLSLPGTLPLGPEGNVQFPGRAGSRPIIPASSSRLGGLVETTRNALPQELRTGFDMWIEETLSRGGEIHRQYFPGKEPPLPEMLLQKQGQIHSPSS
jgi:hypothetical protein